MSKGKPRQNPNKPQNLYAKLGKCAYDDGTEYKECNRPWANKCDGNLYNCYKLRLHHLASLSDKEKEKFLEKFPEPITPYTNLKQFEEKQ